MIRRRSLIMGGGGAAALGTGVVALVLVTSGDTPADRSRKVATAVTAGLVTAMAEAEELEEPYRCARLELEPEEPAPERVHQVGARTLVERGPWLTVGAEGRRNDEVVLGVVADARGAGERTLEHLRALRSRWEQAGVELVLSLGGMGATEDELAEVLGGLAADAPWAVIAVPGDREALPAHRRAIERVNQEGRGVVVDGARVRLVEVGGASIGTFPGVAEAGQLVAGPRGCAHAHDEAMALADALGERDGVRIWAGYAPPRQRGPGTSDATTEGIHIGERMLAEPVARARADLVLHGLVGGPGGPGSDHAPGSREPAILSAGALEAVPAPDRHRSITSGALVVRVTPKRIRWQPLILRRESGH